MLVGIQTMGPLLARNALRREIELGLIRSRPILTELIFGQKNTTDHDILEVFFSEHLNPQEALEAFGFTWEQSVPKLNLDRPSRVHSDHSRASYLAVAHLPGSPKSHIPCNCCANTARCCLL